MQIYFCRFTECLCSKLKQNYSYDKEATSNFDRIGSHITFPFDETTGTSLKFSGFRLDKLRVLFNQPDVVMLQYPLEYEIKKYFLISLKLTLPFYVITKFTFSESS